MRTTTLFFGFCSLLYTCTGAVVSEPNRIITKNLVLDNGLEFGQWGDVEYCYDGSYVHDIEVMFEDYSIVHLDETAINTVKLYCQNPAGQRTGYITSKIGERGEWKGEKLCLNGLMTGLRALVLPYQGSSADDVAVQNLEMQCNYGESTVLALEEAYELNENVMINPGNWSEWAECDSDSAICGLKVRYEQPFLISDTTAVSDISMYCCSVWMPPKDEEN